MRMAMKPLLPSRNWDKAAKNDSSEDYYDSKAEMAEVQSDFWEGG